MDSTCAGSNTHDGVKPDVLLHVFPQVSQEMLPICLHLTESCAVEKMFQRLTMRWQCCHEQMETPNLV